MLYEQDINLVVPNIKRNGRWAPDEHARFVKALQLFGRNWRKVEKFVGTRKGSQIRSHAQKYFLKLSQEGETASDASSSTCASEPVASEAPASAPIPSGVQAYIKHLEGMNVKAYMHGMQVMQRLLLHRMYLQAAQSGNAPHAQVFKRSVSIKGQESKHIIQPIPVKLTRPQATFETSTPEAPVKKIKID
jgi:SHAQKYF class myb-like DNA-binding protein